MQKLRGGSEESEREMERERRDEEDQKRTRYQAEWASESGRSVYDGRVQGVQVAAWPA